MGLATTTSYYTILLSCPLLEIKKGAYRLLKETRAVCIASAVQTAVVSYKPGTVWFGFCLGVQDSIAIT